MIVFSHVFLSYLLIVLHFTLMFKPLQLFQSFSSYYHTSPYIISCLTPLVSHTVIKHLISNTLTLSYTFSSRALTSHPYKTIRTNIPSNMTSFAFPNNDLFLSTKSLICPGLELPYPSSGAHQLPQFHLLPYPHLDM